jgi:hypothetical protein
MKHLTHFSSVPFCLSYVTYFIISSFMNFSHMILKYLFNVTTCDYFNNPLMVICFQFFLQANGARITSWRSLEIPRSNLKRYGIFDVVVNQVHLN